MNYIQNNCKITWDNKLRQFYFKLLHRILVTNKELNRFGIPTDCVKCVLCHENDSIKHAFFDRQSFLKLCVESLQWFNNLHQINVSLTSLQCFLNLPTPNTNLSDNQKRICVFFCYMQTNTTMLAKQCKNKILLNSYPNLLSSLKQTNDLTWLCCPFPQLYTFVQI